MMMIIIIIVTIILPNTKSGIKVWTCMHGTTILVHSLSCI